MTASDSLGMVMQGGAEEDEDVAESADEDVVDEGADDVVDAAANMLIFISPKKTDIYRVKKNRYLIFI